MNSTSAVSTGDQTPNQNDTRSLLMATNSKQMKYNVLRDI